ncbi:MAG: phosphatase [Bacteroidota bacterium]|nr:phosphatase [Bacteroidota bacterium]MDX5404431.1 phosphatase [Bacteroidota bacterium]MDX5447000.1 phosphatase [Bacteroidota bacterium]MDX5505742.1 phosphatase [Bacteroidota bacterium]
MRLFDIVEHYERQGGAFWASLSVLQERLETIDTLIFDWDGVFHDGRKNDQGGSSFSEVDSMGVNMLRFGLFLRQGIMPRCIILTGEDNSTARYFAQREKFDAVVFSAKDKKRAFEQLNEYLPLKGERSLFFFDDILDLGLAADVSLRILIRHSGSPGMTHFIKENDLADYRSGNDANGHGVREATEMLLNCMDKFTETIEKRSSFHADYALYWEKRQSGTTRIFKYDPKGLQSY